MPLITVSNYYDLSLIMFTAVNIIIIFFMSDF